MQFLLKVVIFAISAVATISASCDVCQESNHVACHSRNRYSLCVDGVPTEDYITCPENSVCTLDELVCISEEEATPSCTRDDDDYGDDTPVENNLCGVCEENALIACLSETIYSYCMSGNVPAGGFEMSCPENTVCDIHAQSGFCSDSSLVQPSCIPSMNEDDISNTTPITTEPIATTTSTEPITTTTTTASTTTAEPTTTVTTTEPTTITKPTSTTAEPTTTVTTTEPTTITKPTSTTAEPTTTVTTNEPTTITKPTSTTALPTTTVTTTEPTTSQPTSATTEPTTTVTTTGPTTAAQPTSTTPVPSTTITTTEAIPPTDPTSTTTEPTTKPGTTTTTEPSTPTEPSSTTTEPSTTTTIITESTPVTTPAGPRDPNKLCQDVGTAGFVKPDDDVTCTKFIVCYGNPLQGMEQSCPAGQYFNPDIKFCAVDKPLSCSASTESTTNTPTTMATTVEPTKMPTTEEVTTGTTIVTTKPTTIVTAAPADPRTPAQICQDEGSTGSYKTDDDVSCTKFVLCYSMSGSIHGLQKSCPSGQYFHPEKRFCAADKPDGCL